MDLKDLVTLAERMRDLQHTIAEVEEQEKELKASLRGIEENDLPEMMEELGLEAFALADGRTVGLKVRTHASISQASRPEAHRWLREHEYGDLIKRTLTVSFGKGEDAKAEHLFNELQSRALLSDNSIVSKETVHHSTLKSFVTKGLAAGEEIPQEVFGIHQATIAVIGSVKR